MKAASPRSRSALATAPPARSALRLPEIGVAPMEYLIAWRMALAKDMLRRNEGRIAEIAERVGYSSASTFSVAFTRDRRGANGVSDRLAHGAGEGHAAPQ